MSWVVVRLNRLVVVPNSLSNTKDQSDPVQEPPVARISSKRRLIFTRWSPSCSRPLLVAALGTGMRNVAGRTRQGGGERLVLLLLSDAELVGVGEGVGGGGVGGGVCGGVAAFGEGIHTGTEPQQLSC